MACDWMQFSINELKFVYFVLPWRGLGVLETLMGNVGPKPCLETGWCARTLDARDSYEGEKDDVSFGGN